MILSICLRRKNIFTKKNKKSEIKANGESVKSPFALFLFETHLTECYKRKFTAVEKCRTEEIKERSENEAQHTNSI